MNKAATKQVKNAKEVIADVKATSRKIYLAGLGVYGTTSQQRDKAFKEDAKTSSVIFKDLVKAGAGSLVLSGDSTYRGPTLVDGGLLNPVPVAPTQRTLSTQK